MNDPSLISNLSAVKIIHEDGKKPDEISLRKIRNDVYSGYISKSPAGKFKMALDGFDKNGARIHRMLSAIIEPSEPGKNNTRLN